MTTLARPLRLAEAVGALSLATDLAMGQPLEHGLRTAMLALRMAQAIGLPEDDQVTVFYTGVLHFAGCTAESEIDARFFGDEIAARPQMMAAQFGSRLGLIATATRVVHPESAPLARAAVMARSAFGGIAEFRRWAASHCDVARVLGARMGFSEQIQLALRHLYERWDGKGMPGDLRGAQPMVSEDRLDACLSAMADFADLKSMWTVGHSRGVAQLAGESAVVAGLAAGDVQLLRRAALVHDIGRVAVPVYVWAKPGPLTRGEQEQVRLHAYHSERVLDAVPGLRPLARLAGSHGERCDGSGYHRGSRAGDLPLTVWLLAAADCYQAMREPRAHRPALSLTAAADELCRDAEAGRLAPEAVNAVLIAAGQPRRPVRRPAGLSERECEVLGLIARGLATKQVARRLDISPKTCDHHIQRLYGKIGVSTRAGAALFALEHGLVSAG